ncbi:hypothetical protein D3C72_1784560 [compost metagenome]
MIAHQIHRACRYLRCATALRKHVRKLGTAEQWRDVHSQINRPACFQPGIGHIGPTSPLGFQDPFLANFRVRTSDGREVDSQCLGEFALRGQAVAWPKHTVLHRGKDLRGDLLVSRARACGNGAHPRHVCFFKATRERHVFILMYGFFTNFARQKNVQVGGFNFLYGF